MFNTSSSKLPNKIDTHTHIVGYIGTEYRDFQVAVDQAIMEMNEIDVDVVITMPPPFIKDQIGSFEIDSFDGIELYSRVYLFGGGGSINPILHATPEDPESLIRTELDKMRSKIIGIGEIAFEHFSLGENHVYQSISPYSDSTTALVRAASAYNLPIAIHMEAIPYDMETPEWVKQMSSKNPDTLTNNIPAFKLFLQYALDLGVKIIWLHCGWDNTTYRTPELCEELLSQYPNLYMDLKIAPMNPDSLKLVVNDELETSWANLFSKYSTRFMLGSDAFFFAPEIELFEDVNFDFMWNSLLYPNLNEFTIKFARTNIKEIFV